MSVVWVVRYEENKEKEGASEGKRVGRGLKKGSHWSIGAKTQRGGVGGVGVTINRPPKPSKQG